MTHAIRIPTRAVVPLVAVLASALPATGARAQDAYADPGIEARIWFDRGVEPVLERGERVRIYYRVDRNAHVAVFQIDSDGRTRLIFPRDPGQDTWVLGGRDYRLLHRRSTHWYVRDEPGVGYYFIVASPDPLDLSAFRYSRYEDEWDLGFVANEVYSDPFVAMDEYVTAMIPDWEYAPYALDYAEYRVGADHRYPRFLCYDCHSYRPYAVWNPYLHACTSFRVVIWDRPYYYPAARYRGTRVVYARRPDNRPPRYTFKERADGESADPLRRNPGANPGEPAPRRTGRDGLRRADGSSPDRIRRSGVGSGSVVSPRSGLPGRRVAPPVRTRERPTLERRPPASRSRVRPSGRVRPSDAVRRPAGDARRGGAIRRSGGSSSPGAVRRPPSPSRSGGEVRRSGGSTRGSVRRSGGANRSGTVRRSGGANRAPVVRRRSGGDSPARSARPSRPPRERAAPSRPPPRSGGVRSSSGPRPSSARPPARAGSRRSGPPPPRAAPSSSRSGGTPRTSSRRRPRGG